jgi:transcriptional regulator with PAS, ATPase and Fis domain
MTDEPISRATHTVAVGADGRQHSLVQRFDLRVLQGPEAGTVFHSKGVRTRIGGDPTNDVQLSDTTVSRFHCEIVLKEGRPVIRDLQSRNETLVDDVSVVEGNLADQNTIRMGRTVLRFEATTEKVSVEISQGKRFGSLWGESLPMRETFALLEKAAGGDVTVLMAGETGTGKGAAAEAIHQASSRKDGPFVVVDCGAIAPALLESELFGHKQGAFTGAKDDRPGAFHAADGGTLFLDEIGELSLELQPKILRAIEKKQVRPVGAQTYSPVDVRIIAATNRDLRTDVNQKRFRADLYFRLAVIEIVLPPLRERTIDLPGLVDELLSTLGTRGPDWMRAPDFLAQLAHHHWPGNLRELRNYLERCLILGEAHAASAEIDPTGAPGTIPLRRAKEQFERQYLEELMRAHPGNVSQAARAAGLDRQNLYRLLWKHKLR